MSQCPASLDSGHSWAPPNNSDQWGEYSSLVRIPIAILSDDHIIDHLRFVVSVSFEMSRMSAAAAAPMR